MEANNRIKGVTVNSLLHFIEVVNILTATLAGEQSLVIMEGLNPLLLAQKSSDGLLQPTSLAFEFMSSLSKLRKSQNVIILWFSTALPKNSIGGLREGSHRDPLAVLWKERCNRVIQHVVP